MELLKGINQIKLPLPGAASGDVNVYIIEGDSGNLMIDTGWNTAESFNTLAREMKNSGFAMKDITHIAVTHLHPDHFGLAGKIAELTGAKIFISDIEYSHLDSRYVHPEELLSQMSSFLKMNGVPDWELKMLTEASVSLQSGISQLISAELLKPGDRVSMEPFEFQAILTPGHASGHLCLYEPNKKYLFTGDHILAEILPAVTYHPQSGDNPLGDYFTSLNTISTLEVRFVFPGHGAVFSGLAPKIDNIIHLYKDRLKNTQKAMGMEIKNAYDLAKALSWHMDGNTVNYDKLEPAGKRQAVLGTLAYLQYLVAEESGKKITEPERITYWIGE